MKKRIVSVLVVLCMMLTLLPASALAAEPEDEGIMPLTTVDDHTPPTVTDRKSVV